MNADFLVALEQLEKERNIKKEVLLEAVKQAIINAYKKNSGYSGDIKIDIDEKDGTIRVFNPLTIVDDDKEELQDNELTAEYAYRIYKKQFNPGDIVMEEIFPKNFGRIAAQAARQIVVQKIKEAEKDIIYDEFKKRETEIITGKISKISKNNVFVDISIIGENSLTISTEGILPISEQVKWEEYRPGDRLKVYILEVKKTAGKTQVVLSRSHPGFIKRLFEAEVPEIYDGIVVISNIAREAGSRTKMAVYSESENVYPIGACVGSAGQRINEVVSEINDEKIDIIEYDKDPKKFISASLSPAKVLNVEIDEAEKIALVTVPDDKLSLAIGKEGQNVRLAAKLTNWKIDIKSQTQYETMKNSQNKDSEIADDTKED